MNFGQLSPPAPMGTRAGKSEPRPQLSYFGLKFLSLTGPYWGPEGFALSSRNSRGQR